MSDSDGYYVNPFLDLLNLSNNNSKSKPASAKNNQGIKVILEQNDVSLAEFLSNNPNNYNEILHKYQNKKSNLKDNFNNFASPSFEKYIANYKKTSNKEHINNPKKNKQNVMPKKSKIAVPKALTDNTEHNDFDTNFMEPKLDTDLFMENMKQVNPLNKKGRDIHPKNKIKINKNNLHSSPKNIEFVVLNQQDYIQVHRLGFDAFKFSQLQNGFFSIEARLDLHGLNSIQAYAALHNFMKTTWHKNLGCVLIVCGRGHNSLNGFAVLKYKLIEWLTQEPFKHVVSAFCSARPYDGGVGSLYVLLQKYSSNNKIAWDSYPIDPDLF